MTAEVALRWGTSLVAVAALAGVALLLAGDAGPVLALVVVLVPSAALAWHLWQRALEAEDVARQQAKHTAQLAERGPVYSPEPKASDERPRWSAGGV